MKAYPEYKDSGVEWLGEIPKHWRKSKLKWCIKIRNGQDYKTVEANSERNSYPVIGSGGEFARATKFLHDGESILLGRKGTIDKPIYINGKFWTVDTMFYSNIDTGSDGKYLFYSTLIIPFGYYQTNTTIPSMTQDDLGNHFISLPEISEQIEIRSYLDRETARIDQLITEKQNFIKLLKEKRQALISHVVTKGLDPDVKMKDSGVEWIGEIPSGWVAKRLKFLCGLQTGDKDTINAVPNGKYDFFVRAQKIERINAYTHDCEAVLTAGDGVGVGKVFHYTNGKFSFHQRVYMMNNFRGISAHFFFYFLSTLFARVALDGGAKSTVDSLRMPVFTNFKLCVPNVKEQYGIVSFLDRETAGIDQLITETQNSITLTKEHRTALISAAVTGKIDVRNQ